MSTAARRRCPGCGQFAGMGHNCPARAKMGTVPAALDFARTATRAGVAGPGSAPAMGQQYSALYTGFQTRLAAPIEVSETVDLLAADAPDIAFHDHSPRPAEGGWTGLAAMRDPDAAGNNCFAATHAVHEHVTTRVGVPEGWDAGTVELVFNDGQGVHWANTLTDEHGEEWVMDYTARQFDPAAPFPMVARRSAWQTWVADRASAAWGYRLTEAVLY